MIRCTRPSLLAELVGPFRDHLHCHCHKGSLLREDTHAHALKYLVCACTLVAWSWRKMCAPPCTRLLIACDFCAPASLSSFCCSRSLQGVHRDSWGARQDQLEQCGPPCSVMLTKNFSGHRPNNNAAVYLRIVLNCMENLCLACMP
jgi:hypothetical protein